MVPFKAGERVTPREGDLKGTVVKVIRDAPDGENQLLRVRWEGGSEEQVSGRDLASWIEKRGLGRDEGRCPECGAPTGTHLAGCSKG
jgi:hypothetical protein